MRPRNWLVGLLIAVLMPFLMIGGCTMLGALDESSQAATCGTGARAHTGSLTIKGRSATPEQVDIARKIIAIGYGRGFSDRDILIALMVGIQESSLTNVSYGTYNAEAGTMSLGVFQQTPPWWGTPEQIMDVAYATNRFYNGVAGVRNRDTMSLLDVALAVQNPSREAYLSPGNYFPSWQPEAESLLAAFSEYNEQCEAEQVGVPGKVVVAEGANLPGRPMAPETLEFLALVAGLYGEPIVVTTGTNHSYFTVDGNVSDHATGHAADFDMVANGGYDDSPVGDRLATACLVAGGMTPAVAAQEARIGGLWSLQRYGLNIQCIWKTYQGGNHHDHVHIGANPNG